MDPSGKIIQTNVPSGVFGHFLGWPSLDWLGNSPFSQGGGFYPVKNKDNTSTVLFAPINQTGTYTLLTHSTLFGGSSTTEPVTLAAKFSNIPSTVISKNEQINDESENIIPQEKSILLHETIPEDKIIENTLSNSSLGLGVVIGIVIGIAIGIVFVFIIRQKSSK
jgi:hypothetical protein